MIKELLKGRLYPKSFEIKLNSIINFLHSNFGNHYFPNLRVGDRVIVEMFGKEHTVKLTRCGKNGDIRNCLFFVHKKVEYYLSDDNFVEVLI